MPTLRNNPQSSLWNYEVSKWNEEQKKQYEYLHTGIMYQKPEPIIRKQLKKKVVRVSDGKVYGSIKECGNYNGLSYPTVSRALKKGIKFKYYDSTL